MIARKIVVVGVALAAAAVLGSGCGAAGVRQEAGAPAAERAGEAGGSLGASAGALRVLIRSASLKVEADDIAAVALSAKRIAKEAGGWVENDWVDPHRAASLALRVPEPKLEATLDALSALGDVEARSISARDVTEEVIDVEAKLQNLRAVRDRLREHLAKTGGVQDVIALEKELARVQAEIDSFEGRLKWLRSNAAMSSIHFHAERGTALGPLGWVGYGAWWVIEKLFVIR